MENSDAVPFFTECPGCPEGHSSMWKTLIESPQWNLWKKDVRKRFKEGVQKGDIRIENVYDVDECEQTGIMSKGHFQAFLKFVRETPAVPLS